MLKYLPIVLFTILFSWISFFPQPLQGKYHLFTKIFLVLAFIGLLAKKRTSIFRRDDLFLWGFLITIGLNVLFAQRKEVAFRTYIDLAIPMFLIYYLASEGFSSQSNFNLLAKVICILSILVALGGIFESIFRVNPLYEYFIENPFYERYIIGFVRPMSTQFNPAPLGSYLLGSLPFSFLLFKQDKSFFRWLGILGLILNTTVMILTFSRSVFLGLIAMIILYLFVLRDYRSMAIFFVVLSIIIFITFFLPYPFCRLGVKWMLGEMGILSSYRIDRCIMAYHMIQDYPFVGLGFQHFRIRFYEYSLLPFNISYEFMIADNMYLTILTETGIFGFLGFFAFIFFLFKKAWRNLRRESLIPQRRWQLLVSLMALVGLLVAMGGYELFYWANPYLYFCVIVGCIASFCRDKNEFTTVS